MATQACSRQSLPSHIRQLEQEAAGAYRPKHGTRPRRVQEEKPHYNVCAVGPLGSHCDRFDTRPVFQVLRPQCHSRHGRLFIRLGSPVQDGEIVCALSRTRMPIDSQPLPLQICQTTGWGGQPVRAPGHGGSSDEDLASRLQPVKDAKRIRVTFNASVSDVLPWKFVPQQREVRVLPGETALAFYTATNKSDSDIIGVATYSVTPGQLAPYFSKIQCFCFEEQRLNAGETVDMPVFFYLDPDMLNDLNTRGIETVTLSYTFFSKLPSHAPMLPCRVFLSYVLTIHVEAKYDNNGNLKGFPQS